MYFYNILAMKNNFCSFIFLIFLWWRDRMKIFLLVWNVGQILCSTFSSNIYHLKYKNEVKSDVKVNYLAMKCDVNRQNIFSVHLF